LDIKQFNFSETVTLVESIAEFFPDHLHVFKNYVDAAIGTQHFEDFKDQKN